MDYGDLENRFTYHPPVTEGQAALYQSVRDQAHELARWINHEVLDSREKSLAITKLEEAVFWANAAIARHSG